MTLFTGPAGENPLGIEGLVRRLIERSYSGSIIFEQWPRPASVLRENPMQRPKRADEQ